ncbi:MAG: glycoside hydrolase family 16 protein, partial [Flavobacteriaceae bacterium]|nr:glycoside hydrolase family 16 protein [Flavobacteriaceae bacterium]
MNHKFLSIIVVMLFFVASCNKEKNSSDENSQPQNENKEYQLVWSDDFEENIINEDNWTFEIWDAGRVNNEWQQYVENTDNYKLENGFLHIIVTKTGANEKGGYTSTRLVSKGKKEFTYGRIEFRAKMPKGVGTWPALWMLGSNI